MDNIFEKFNYKKLNVKSLDIYVNKLKFDGTKFYKGHVGNRDVQVIFDNLP